jgi:Protein of unknown function (DUF2865)
MFGIARLLRRRHARGRPAVPRCLPLWTLALAFVASAAINGPASAQSAGCNRCIQIGPFSFPNPFAGPWSAPSETPGVRARHGWERRRAASSGERSAREGGSKYVCVKTCDGSFFPLPYSRASGATREEVCQALCPNADVSLYTMPFGGTIDEGVSSTGSPYMALPNALKFQQSYESSCSCRRPGQSWADALAAAEARFGHRKHDIVVTEEASALMSRPRLDPKAKPPASIPANSKNDQAADSLDRGLDIDGVDTKLRAATAAVSRGTSGIKEDDGHGGSFFGLSQGQVVHESDPDGGQRRVRILNPMF